MKSAWRMKRSRTIASTPTVDAIVATLLARRPEGAGGVEGADPRRRRIAPVDDALAE